MLPLLFLFVDMPEFLQDVLLQAVQSGQQPGDLHAEGPGSLGSSSNTLGHLAALLSEEAALTPEQLQMLSRRLQQQLDEQRAALQAEAEEEEEEEGSTYDVEGEGAEFSFQEEGEALEFEAPGGAGPSSGTKAHYEALLLEPLWRCQEEVAQVQLYQALFLLLAWKMDYVVRDTAFIALLGIMCHLLLPKVSMTCIVPGALMCGRNVRSVHRRFAGCRRAVFCMAAQRCYLAHPCVAICMLACGYGLCAVRCA